LKLEAGMKTYLAHFALAVVLAGSVIGCALHRATVADLQRSPGRYQNQIVSIDGVVTDSWGVPFVPFRFYQVDDGTGRITVVSNSTAMPARGERVRVRGRIEDIAMLGGRPLGLHLREESLDVRR
jgi:hypothetical protein